MERLTVDTTLTFCDIAQCASIPGGACCEDGYCDQRRVYERLRGYERTGVEPEEVVAMKETEQKRRKGCEFCMGDVDRRPLLLESYGGDVYICGNGTLTDGDDSTEISVCPMCGRDLRGDSQNGI